MRVRHKFFPNEKPAIIILRRKGHSINLIANMLGRSTSLIHRTIQKLRRYRKGTRFTFPKCLRDLRKIPRRVRERRARRNRKILYSLWQKWEQFIIGEEDEPP